MAPNYFPLSERGQLEALRQQRQERARLVFIELIQRDLLYPEWVEDDVVYMRHLVQTNWIGL